MKKIILLLLLTLFFGTSTFAQQQSTAYWQQEANYSIVVSLNDSNHSLKGYETIEYSNHSPDTLYYIWFHLWPNAYSNDSTAFARQLKKDAEGKKLYRSMKDKGWIDSLDFRCDEIKLVTQPDPQYIDLLKVFLSKPLFPGAKVAISTPFYVSLPTYISRGGHLDHSYMACQWYPKPAVYDRKGWHPIPYLDQGEFYSEFGNFDVSISVPADYVLAATGTIQNKEELAYYKKLGTENYYSRTNKKYQAQINGSIKTIQYKCERIHDFAWFAAKDLVIEYDSLLLPNSGRKVDVFAYHLFHGNKSWDSATNFIKDATLAYSSWLGEYPYDVVQAIEGPSNINSGGMEYPTITLITSPKANKQYLDAVITHEVGHNWLYGMLGSNEREHPWMDEGINTYYQFRYEAEKYRSSTLFGESPPAELKNLSTADFQQVVYNIINTNIHAYMAIDNPAAAFTNKQEYGIVEYEKAATWMYILEMTLGRDKLDNAMRYYFNQWKFRHPYPDDLKHSLEEGSGFGLRELFDLLNKRESLN